LITLFLLLGILTHSPQSIAKPSWGDRCKIILDNAATLRTESMAANWIKYGFDESKKSDNNFVIDKVKYQILGVLDGGNTASTTYLAKAKGGDPVVMQDFPSSPRQQKAILAYEKRLTEFYFENGIFIPGIIAMDVGKGLLVRQYYEGTSLIEMKSHREELGLKKKELTKLESELEDELTKTRKILLGFKSWLTENYPKDLEDMKAIPDLSDRLPTGILASPNFAYSFKLKRWIHIDP
jgi:hypothetical protein